MTKINLLHNKRQLSAYDQMINEAEPFMGDVFISVSREYYPDLNPVERVELMGTGEWQPSREEIRDAMFTSLTIAGYSLNLKKVVDYWESHY
jgi:hypothetical protein